MVIGIALGLVAIGALIVSLRVIMAYNEFEETRRDSEWER